MNLDRRVSLRIAHSFAVVLSQHSGQPYVVGCIVDLIILVSTVEQHSGSR